MITRITRITDYWINLFTCLRNTGPSQYLNSYSTRNHLNALDIMNQVFDVSKEKHLE